MAAEQSRPIAYVSRRTARELFGPTIVEQLLIHPIETATQGWGRQPMTASIAAAAPATDVTQVFENSIATSKSGRLARFPGGGNF